ncbi:transcription factor [Lipomyces kononenkoae]|uniref:Transcription factor n=1 Tax=Lipomyces kononenkoae TaxID=34357 RepID=A0ACC3T7Z9_LIPKO
MDLHDQALTWKIFKPGYYSDHQFKKRVSRACLSCRQRKLKCDLENNGSPGTPPCQRCVRNRRECILGSSQRGGRRTSKKNMKTDTTTKNPDIEASVSNFDSHQTPISAHPGHVGLRPVVATTPSVTIDEDENDDDDKGGVGDASSVDSVPRNPSDAWQCLTGIARETDKARPEARLSAFRSYGAIQDSVSDMPAARGIRAYRLVKTSALDPGGIWQLVDRYAQNFHSYFPLVPRKYFEQNALDAFASNSKHLLTAVLTIASKDLVDKPETHKHCSVYMRELVSDIAAGAECGVEAVEALLLLAEWEPQGLQARVERVGRGEEDRAAWMKIGLAIRVAYFLGLDRTSFRGNSAEDSEMEAHRRLAWISCWISDRLISVRIGRAFWSRGPGPMTGLVSQDFPSLQPQNNGDEDYAQIFQATVELTQIYSNVHDVLYSGMRTSNQMMLMGTYVKYIDDFRLALLRWKSQWGAFNCSQPIQVTLQLSYEYLRLYTNAFAFQSATSQLFSAKAKGKAPSKPENMETFQNIASMEDARFIYESVDAAKAYLTILVESVDPQKHLHFMPVRFYLYSIYAAVFLFKARSFGVMSYWEEMKARDLVARTTVVLELASTGDYDVGSRYAYLLKLLWKPQPAKPASPGTTSEFQPHNVPAIHTSEYASNFGSTSDFSWLDLEAVGDYVSGDGPGADTSGYNAYQPSDGYPLGQDISQLLQPTAWSSDMNRNLLF